MTIPSVSSVKKIFHPKCSVSILRRLFVSLPRSLPRSLPTLCRFGFSYSAVCMGLVMGRVTMSQACIRVFLFLPVSLHSTKSSIFINLPSWEGAVWKYEPTNYQTLEDFTQSTDKYEYFKSELHCFYMYGCTCFLSVLATDVLPVIFTVA